MEDPRFATTVMQEAGSRLEREGVKFDRKAELQKIAHTLVVNTEHPLVLAAAQLERAAFAHYASTETHEKLASAHQKASRALRDKMRGR